MDYNELFKYADELFSTVPEDRRHKGYEAHTRRVFSLAWRLCAALPEADAEAALTAAVFHDVGFATAADAEGHAERGARMWLEYAAAGAFAERVAYLIREHDYAAPDAPIELKILSDADRLAWAAAALAREEESAIGRFLEADFTETAARIRDDLMPKLESRVMCTAPGAAARDEIKRRAECLLARLEADAALFHGRG